MNAATVEQHRSESASQLRKETYTLREFSTLTGIGLTAIRRGIRAGDLPVKPVKIGGTWMFPRRPVDRLIGLDEGN